MPTIHSGRLTNGLPGSCYDRQEGDVAALASFEIDTLGLGGCLGGGLTEASGNSNVEHAQQAATYTTSSNLRKGSCVCLGHAACQRTVAVALFPDRDFCRVRESRPDFAIRSRVDVCCKDRGFPIRLQDVLGWTISSTTLMVELWSATGITDMIVSSEYRGMNSLSQGDTHGKKGKGLHDNVGHQGVCDNVLCRSMNRPCKTEVENVV